MEIVEQTYYRSHGKGILKPFSKIADVENKDYSAELERAVVDFGADHAFGQVNSKLKEHYDIEIPDSAARQITLRHAEKNNNLSQNIIEENINKPSKISVDSGDSTNIKKRIVSETDGVFIPTVET